MGRLPEECERPAQEIARHLSQIQTLREVMMAAASTLDFNQVLKETCRVLQARMQLEYLGFAMMDAEGRLTPYAAQVGYSRRLEQVQLPLDGSVCGRVYQSGEPVIIEDVREEPCYFGLEPEVRSELAVPIRIRGQVVGVLNLESRRVGGFNEEDLAFYSAIAGQLGIALENACLYEEVAEQADDLQAALTRLQELDRFKTRFMQNVSHELRSPLALILGYADYLFEDQSRSMPSYLRELLGLIQEQATTLSQLVEDLTLTWQTETQPIKLQPVAFHDVVQSSVLRFRISAEGKGLSLESSIDKDMLPVRGTPECLRSVVDNLLSNAIKFTPSEGRVLVRLLGGGDNLVLQVSDTGIGIAPEHHKRIFDRFYQVAGSGSRHHRGMGLGLALVHEIVEACDGSISVESELGRGSTFTVRLPTWSLDAVRNGDSAPHARSLRTHEPPRPVPVCSQAPASSTALT